MKKDLVDWRCLLLLVSAVYEFVRSLLETPERKFVLCLPPRSKLVEPSITLFKAGLSPASNVLFGWIEKGEKGIVFNEDWEELPGN